jgi:hypothetical protein
LKANDELKRRVESLESGLNKETTPMRTTGKSQGVLDELSYISHVESRTTDNRHQLREQQTNLTASTERFNNDKRGQELMKLKKEYHNMVR